MKTVTTAIPKNIHVSLKIVAAHRQVSLMELMVEYLKRGLRRDGQEVRDE